MYEGLDYPTVTLFDLQRTHNFLEDVYQESDAVVDRLIASKTKYLEKTYGGIPGVS